jgi:integrase/recombinase XerD
MRIDSYPETEQWILQYKDHLLKEGKEESTIKLYGTEIAHFLGWLDRTGKVLASVMQEDIFASRDELYNRGKRLSTINKYVSILASFFRWAEEQGMVKGNPAATARYFTPKSTEFPRWLCGEEEERLIRLAVNEKNPFKRARNEALLHVLLYSGLRVEEVPNLRLGSVQEELIVYDEAKEIRRVPIPRETYEKLTQWMQERAAADKDIYNESEYLFVTERSGRMQVRAVQFVIESYAEKLGFDVSCHDLRNTYCRKLASLRTPILHLKTWAGHKSFLTTYQYYAGLQ